MSLGMLDPKALGQEEEREVARFRWALELEANFAFHVIVAESRDALDDALMHVHAPLHILRPRPPRNLTAQESAEWILSELDRQIESAHGAPLLLDAMIAHREPAWAMVLRRLNELRNGLELRHRGPLLLAVTPEGESLLGREAPDLWSRRGSGMRLRDRRYSFLNTTGTESSLPPPENPAAFESLCFDLFRETWNDPGIQRFGRSGQPESGVDIFGRTVDGWIGVQCKPRSGLLRTKLTFGELEQEAARAKSFRPRLDKFIVATTGPRDGLLQQRARELSAASGLEIQVWSWEDLWHEIRQRRDLLDHIASHYWPQLSRAQRLSPSRLSLVVGTLFGREDELATLDAAWEHSKTYVMTVVGWGGSGKSSLVSHWASKLAMEDYEGADYFDWSFYSQGTGERGGATADAFVDVALRFFGDAATAESSRSPWDKGSQLAKRVAQRRTLLILDGLEPLQHPPGPLTGALKDPAISALLKGLATKNPGLCLVTTRQSIVDLAPYRNSTALELRLDRLPTSAGVNMLATLGVHGPERQLEQLVEEVQGHALTLSLLGHYLVAAHGGDVRRHDRLGLEQADRNQGGHAQRLIAAYESWLATGSEESHQLLAILRVLGLFDRPASGDCLGALRKPPAIQGLTEPLIELTEEDWNLSVARLAEMGLLAPDFSLSDGSALDSHPLVREYFSRQVRSQNSSAWRAAHSRLFEFLAETTEYRPDTLEGLQPLYQAVLHGCQAGRHEEALRRVYFDRILRGGEHFATRKLGAYGMDLSALGCFFDRPWKLVSPLVADDDKAWLLNQAGFYLRVLGRLVEATEPIRIGLQSRIDQSDWKNGAILAVNLSELEVTVGDLAGGIRDSELAVAYANRSGGLLERMLAQTVLANNLHQVGRRSDSLTSFRVAERLKVKWQPEYPLLTSSAGFQYCDLLLAEAERAAGSGLANLEALKACRSVEERAAETLEWAVVNRGALLDIALDHLTLGRARLYQTLLDGALHLDAKTDVETAVDGLRRAGQVAYLALGLMTRAWLRAAQGDTVGARDDLSEARDIAERGPMPLLLADIHLQRARHFHDRGALAEVRKLIEEHGYGRRLEELGDLEAMASEWQVMTLG